MTESQPEPQQPQLEAAPPSLRRWMWERRWLIVGLAVLFTLPRIWYYWTFQAADFDVGIYHGLSASLADGRGFFSDILGRNHLAEHWNPVMFLFALLYKLWASAYWLMLGQAAAATGTVLGLVWLAEQEIAPLTAGRRRAAWWGLLLLFVIYRPFCAAWWFSFQPMILGSPCVAWALVFLHLGRMRSLTVAVLLLLTTREAAVLTCFGLAWYAWQVTGRPRAALAIAAAAAAATLIIFGLVMPWAQHGHGWDHTKRLGVFADPLGKLQYLGSLLWRAGFLPALAPRIALAAGPAVALHLVVSTSNLYSGGFHYNAQLSVFLLAASAVGMARLLQWVPPEPRWQTLPVAAACGMLVLGASTGDILPLRKFVSALAPGRWIACRVLQNDLAAALVAARIPERAPLAADVFLGPHLCARLGYHTLDGNSTEAKVQGLPPGLPIVVRTEWWDEQIRKYPELPRLVRPVAAVGGIQVLERDPRDAR